jgi:hypothetical protein
MQAAEAVGDPGNHGRGGLMGYLIWLARKEPRTFAALLERLPIQEVFERRAELDNAHQTLMDRVTAYAERMQAHI